MFIPQKNVYSLTCPNTSRDAYKQTHTQVGGGMDGLFLSHANAYSLTYPGFNWQVASHD